MLGASLSTGLLFYLVQPAPEDQNLIKVYVADQFIEANTSINPDSLKAKKIKKSNYHEGMLTQIHDPPGWTKSDILPGEIIREEKLRINQPISLGKGERTMNVPVTLDRIGGYPRKGDYVDVIAYFKQQDTGVSKLILQDLQIVDIYNHRGISIDNQPMQEEPLDEKSHLPAVLTLKVSTDQGEVLNHALEAGTIRLLSREITD
ncbi:MAG: hypothetical protein H0Z33_04905 [Bacillaceae bacterium]|nr:hypothetical protein [Bacillaceae bacterium]